MEAQYKVTKDFGNSWQHKNRTNLDNIALDYLISNFPIKSFVDIGCGPGGQVKEALKRGLEAIGIEGDPVLTIYEDKEHFLHHDYTDGELKIKMCDLCWSMEFLEHVMETYIPNIFSSFVNCKYVFCTHAVPGQGGRHHVNCQTDEYWIDIFKSYEFEYNNDVSQELRKISESKWTKNSGMFFLNKKMEYDVYINHQKKRAKKTLYKTIKAEKTRLWLYQHMQQLNVEGESILCVGARHKSEMDFFTKKGYGVDAIDLYNKGRIMECDMSKMLDDDYLRDKTYDIIMSIDSLEHCIDLEGFIKGLNKLCKGYFICVMPGLRPGKEASINASEWDCARHEFVVGFPDEDICRKKLIDTFTEFDVIMNKSYEKKRRLLFVLRKKNY